MRTWFEYLCETLGFGYLYDRIRLSICVRGLAWVFLGEAWFEYFCHAYMFYAPFERYV